MQSETNVTISESHNYDDSHLWDIYNTSFPPHETRPVQRTVEMLRTHPNYRLFAARTDHTVGFALVYVFDDFALLDYMAVSESCRSGGVGSRLLKYVLAQQYGPVLLEIQKENGIQDNKRRIEFYKRCGAMTILENYYLPSYTSDPDEEMYLMACGAEPEHMAPEQLKKYISEIYRRVYGCARDDLIKRSLGSSDMNV